MGACGHAYTGEATLVPDLPGPPQLAGAAPRSCRRTHACWSTPIKSSHGQVIGTFAFYYHDHAGPVELRRLVEAGTTCAPWRWSGKKRATGSAGWPSTTS
jgi:hypothetical protein